MTNRYENNTSDRSTTEGASERSATECDHAIALVLHGTDPVGINFNYCPKCGEKLEENL